MLSSLGHGSVRVAIGVSTDAAFLAEKRWSDLCRLAVRRKQVVNDVFDEESLALSYIVSIMLVENSKYFAGRKAQVH